MLFLSFFIHCDESMKFKITSILLLIFCTPIALKAQTQANDFNADGFSDFVLMSVNADQTIGWSYQDTVSGALVNLSSIGNITDIPILARWKGTGLPQVGAVTYDTAEEELIWKIVNDTGAIEERSFGTNKHTVISGGDFNGNGFVDAAIAVLKRKRVYWQINYDLFANSVGKENIASLRFGREGDRVFFASPDGVSDWIGTFGRGSGGKPLLRLKSLITGEVRNYTEFPAGLITGVRPRPVPVKLASGIDILAFVYPSKITTKIEIRDLAGTLVSETTLDGAGEVVVGNFNNEPGEEIAVRGSQGFSVYNPTSLTTNIVSTTTSLTLADEINIGSLKSISSGGGGSSNGSNNNEGGATGGPGNVSSCSSVTSWPSASHVYKTVGSDHFSPGDPRRSSANVLIKPGGSGPFPSCINIVDTKGNIVSKMGLYARGDGWAARYYSGFGCGSSFAINGSAVARKAKSNTGSSNIYANFGGKCYGPIDASKCIGSKHC
jgi:hypothetical protein